MNEFHPWRGPQAVRTTKRITPLRHSCSGGCCDDAEVPRDDCPHLDDAMTQSFSPVGRTHREAMWERAAKAAAESEDRAWRLLEAKDTPGTLRSLDDKLRIFDQHADQARDELVRLLTEDWEYVKAVARGRHAWGHFRYGDNLMFEYEPNQLIAETVEELADGVVYTARRLSL